MQGQVFHSARRPCVLFQVSEHIKCNIYNFTSPWKVHDQADKVKLSNHSELFLIPIFQYSLIFLTNKKIYILTNIKMHSFQNTIFHLSSETKAVLIYCQKVMQQKIVKTKNVNSSDHLHLAEYENNCSIVGIPAKKITLGNPSNSQKIQH